MNAADFFRIAWALDRAVRAGDRTAVVAVADGVRRDGRPELADRIEQELLHPETTPTSR